jgi:hypothetical protein
MLWQSSVVEMIMGATGSSSANDVSPDSSINRREINML